MHWRIPILVTLDITPQDRALLVLFATSILRNHEDAEDAVQDALLSAWQNGQFRGESSLFTYLRVCVKNQCLIQIRRRRTLEPLPDLFYQPRTDSAIDARRKLATCYRVLSGRGRHVEVAKHISTGMTYLEVSRRLGMPVGSVKCITFRVRQILLLSKRVKAA